MRPFNVEKVKLQGKRHDNNTIPATKESPIFVEEWDASTEEIWDS